MGLIQNATAAALRGRAVALATLELPEGVVAARCLANLTRQRINDILAAPADAIANYLATKPAHMGDIHIGSFSPRTTFVSDLFRWVEGLEARTGRRIDALVLDYADKLAAKGDPDRDNTYQSTGNIYEDLLEWAKAKSKWVWTGSQSKRGKEKRTQAVLTCDDVADSMNKIRHADLVITLNPREEAMLAFFVAKNRLGESDVMVGPLPTEFECARIGPALGV